MPVTVREPSNKDFFAWLDLYAGYCDGYKVPLNDQKALLVWSWLMDAKHPLQALVATVEGGALVGLAHFRPFPRPLHGSTWMMVDDLFTAPALRGHGVARDLLAAVKARASATGCTGLRLVSSPDNVEATSLYSDVAARTDAVTYEVEL